MSDDPIDATRLYAESRGLTFTDHGDGHVKISGHGQVVHYWPVSKKRTAHRMSDNRIVRACSPWDAIKLLLHGAKRTGMAPEGKFTKNPPGKASDLKAITTNPAGLRHLYAGARPPWEFPTFIAAQSDLTRIEAAALRDAADAMDAINLAEVSATQ